MKEKVHPTNDLYKLFKKFGDSDVLVINDDKYEYIITKKRKRHEQGHSPKAE